MSAPIPQTLTLIQDLLSHLKESSVILADPDTAAYFRALRDPPRLKSIETPPPPPAPPLLLQPPPLPKKDPPPAPPPLKKEEPVSIEKEKATPKKSLGPMRALVAKIAPELAILDEIPNDKIAKQMANRWKTKNQSAPISLLSSGEQPLHKLFLQEIATALEVRFGGAKWIEADTMEKEKEWEMFFSTEGLKLVIICDSTLWQLHHLRAFYKELPTTGVRMLHKTPLFLLPDLSLYLKDPLLKRSLWKALCQKLSVS